MSKRLFILLVILMSLSLSGIIFVQGYWITTAVENKEEQFSMNVNQVLKDVATNIQKREYLDFYAKYQKLIDSVGNPKESQIREFVVFEENKNTNETYIYSHGVLQEDYDISARFFENGAESDTTSIMNLISRRTTTIIKEDFDEEGNKISPEKRLERIGKLTEIDKAWFETSFVDLAKRTPIHKRVSAKEIEFALHNELVSRDIETLFEFGVYSNGLATRVKSMDYKPVLGNKQYKVPLFIDNEGKSDFDLIVTFPKKKNFLFSQVIGMALLSIIFTLIIIIAYSSALYQLIKQKQISEIKTDFINNMTHEFKTPIATINLALDAIKNPKVLTDDEKVKRYLSMIRDENKRMHAQVENVLRISKLEKNQLDISKDRVEVHDLINEAIAHVSLIAQDRQGYIKTHFEADRDEVLASEVHFTNVLVNMLDNAIKYSPDAPKVDVYTENVKNSIVLKVVDQGSGMSKTVQKKIFEKFYREHTGNIHNVKGHGLGLAYVKRIVDDHHGEVYVESEKDKGSTFFIKLPLI